MIEIEHGQLTGAIQYNSIFLKDYWNNSRFQYYWNIVEIIQYSNRIQSFNIFEINTCSRSELIQYSSRLLKCIEYSIIQYDWNTIKIVQYFNITQYLNIIEIEHGQPTGANSIEFNIIDMFLK